MTVLPSSSKTRARRSQRRGREIRRVDLVQRQRHRRPRQLHGRQGAEGNALPRLSPRSPEQRAYRRGGRYGAATASPSPDERKLYVVDTPDGPRSTRVFDVQVDKAVNGRLFFDGKGFADGIRVDTEGNVWAAFSGGAGEDGVAVFAPDGTLIGRILLPERCANLCFGGRKRNRLFMTASQSVYALYVEAISVAGG